MNFCCVKKSRKFFNRILSLQKKYHALYCFRLIIIRAWHERSLKNNLLQSYKLFYITILGTVFLERFQLKKLCVVCFRYFRSFIWCVAKISCCTYSWAMEITLHHPVGRVVSEPEYRIDGVRVWFMAEINMLFKYILWINIVENQTISFFRVRSIRVIC